VKNLKFGQSFTMYGFTEAEILLIPQS